MSNISSVYNSITRMTGLSGIDVDGMVSQLMLLERAKVDKVSQNRQLLLWKQEQYREITSSLQSFTSEYFNALKPSTDMRSSAIYNAFSIKYDGLDSNAYFSAVAGGGAKTGDYIIKNIQTALAANVTGTSASRGITGASLTSAQIDSISADLDNNRFYAEFNGQKVEISFSDSVNTITGLRDELQSKLDTAFGSNAIQVGIDTDKLTFTTNSTNTLKLSNTINGGYATIFGSDLSSGIKPMGMNSRFKISIGSDSEEFALTPGTTYTADQVKTTIQGMVDTRFGSGRIVVDIKDNKLTLGSTDPDVTVAASAAESGGLAALGLGGTNVSNRIDLDAHLYDIRDNFANTVTLTADTTDNDINFSINGQAFSFNSANTSLNDIMSQVNSNTAAGVKMSYDSLNDRFILDSKTTGAAAVIKASDTSGGLLGALSLTTSATGATGRDASITYNDGSLINGVNVDQVITRSTNSFTVNGINFNLKKDYTTGSVNLSVGSDPTKAVELIKGFVSKYNEVLDKINTKLSESREYSYLPLTDSQKEAMTEDDIKKWEEKAKSGLLSSDGILRSIATEMRSALNESVSGTGITLASIGIKSNSWVDKGKLYVDENKLKEALANNPDEVFSLFTKQSDKTYTQAVSDPTARAERNTENGLIYRLNDIIQDNIRTNTINSHRGALLEKAGATGDRSQFSNSLFDQISDYDDKIAEMNDELTAKENSYYDQFSRLETLINQMNSQSNWIAQQFSR
ncbi:MAG TPA: flagellar filament capping protein FliD [Clostridia bacterium]|nr:flagellar filament capping protein FliD [Clostridia bacterium]